jgi:hypothetical protein
MTRRRSKPSQQHVLLGKRELSDPKRLQQVLVKREIDSRPHRAAGSFDFPVSAVGSTTDGRITLYYDPSTGAEGLALAQAILPQLQQLLVDDDVLFGVTAPCGNVLLVALDGQTDGSAGAYHYGCDFTTGGDWYEDVALGDVPLTFGLVQAEVVESYMGLQGKGWDCGASNGEALSRFLAESVSGGPQGALVDFSTGPAWYTAGMPDFISTTDPTDQNAISTGCAIVYLYWLVSRGLTPAQIVQAGCPDGTLASNYQALGLGPDAWADFSAAAGALASIDGDDPWGASAPPPPPPPPPGNVLVPGTWRLQSGSYTFIVP